MMRNEYAALLDLDGTLIDSLHIYYAAVSNVLSRFGVSCTYEEMHDLAGSSGVELYTHFLKKYGKYDPSMGDFIYEIYDNSIYKDVENVTFPSKSSFAIASLKYLGYKTAICTGASRKFVDTVVPDSVLDMIDCVVTCDDVAELKPNPETFLMAADELGIHPSNCVVIGDSSGDLIGASRAGMKFVIVRNDYNRDITDGYAMEINDIMEYVI